MSAAIEFGLEHIFSYAGALAPPEIIGEVPEGLRVNFYSTGGQITGPKIRGVVRPVGGDWRTVRRDGVAYLNVRTTFETHDQAVILVTYEGVIDLGESGYQAFLRGELPEVAKLRISPRFVTSHAGYLWLNRLFCIGVGEYRAQTNVATYDVHAVR
ncbi:MAG TPA: DUF3237 domain-containing protein [Longimicrobiales bacterium]